MLKKIIILPFRNIVKAIINPSSLVEELSEEPDFLTPLILIFLVLLSTVFYLYLYTSKIFVQEGDKIISFWNFAILPNISLVIAGRLLGLIIMWFLLFTSYYLIGRGFGSSKPVISLFSISGMSYSIQLLYILFDAMILVFYINSLPATIIQGLVNNKMMESSSFILNFIYNEIKYIPFFKIREFYGWFFTLWEVVFNIIVMRYNRELEFRKAVVSGIFVSLVMMFTALFLQGTFLLV